MDGAREPSDVVVLHVPGAIEPRFVLALRRVVPDLPPIGSGPLLAKLRRSGSVVLGRFSSERAEEILHTGRVEGLTFQILPRYDRALVIETVGLDPFENGAVGLIEAVFRPAFDPELVVRISTHPSRLTVATCGASIWWRLYEPEPWLEPRFDAPSRPPLSPWRCDVVLPEGAHRAVDAALDAALTEQDHAVGADGMTVQFRRGSPTSDLEELETWSPTPADRPRRHALAFEVLRMVDDHVGDARTLEVVGQVMRQLALPPDEDFVEERDLDPGPFHCCGDEDLLPFRCIACRHLMVLCYECDTLYPDLRDLTRRVPHPAQCSGCGASTGDVTTTSAAHRSRRPAWMRAGLVALLKPRRRIT